MEVPHERPSKRISENSYFSYFKTLTNSLIFLNHRFFTFVSRTKFVSSERPKYVDKVFEKDFYNIRNLKICSLRKHQ